MKLEQQKWQCAHSLSSAGCSLMPPPCSEPHFLFLCEESCGFSFPSLALQHLLRHQNIRDTRASSEGPGRGGLTLQVASHRASTVSQYTTGLPQSCSALGASEAAPGNPIAFFWCKFLTSWVKCTGEGHSEQVEFLFIIYCSLLIKHVSEVLPTHLQPLAAESR